GKRLFRHRDGAEAFPPHLVALRRGAVLPRLPAPSGDGCPATLAAFPRRLARPPPLPYGGHPDGADGSDGGVLSAAAARMGIAARIGDRSQGSTADRIRAAAR